MDELLLPHELERIVDEYLLPKYEMDIVIKMIERMFNTENTHYSFSSSKWFHFRPCDDCEYKGFTFDLGDYGDYCLDCLPEDYKGDHSVYFR